MKRRFIFAALVLSVFLTSCARKDQAATDTAPHVTVTLRDGTRVGGSILDNSATKVTVAGDDGITRSLSAPFIAGLAASAVRQVEVEILRPRPDRSGSPRIVNQRRRTCHLRRHRQRQRNPGSAWSRMARPNLIPIRLKRRLRPRHTSWPPGPWFRFVRRRT